VLVEGQPEARVCDDCMEPAGGEGSGGGGGGASDAPSAPPASGGGGKAEPAGEGGKVDMGSGLPIPGALGASEQAQQQAEPEVVHATAALVSYIRIPPADVNSSQVISAVHSSSDPSLQVP